MSWSFAKFSLDILYSKIFFPLGGEYGSCCSGLGGETIQPQTFKIIGIDKVPHIRHKPPGGPVL